MHCNPANQHCNPPAQLLTAGLSCWCHSAQPLSPWNGRRGSFGALGFSGGGSGVWGEAALLRSSRLLRLLWPGCLKISWHWDTGQRAHSLTQDRTQRRQQHLRSIIRTGRGACLRNYGDRPEGWKRCLRSEISQDVKESTDGAEEDNGEKRRRRRTTTTTMMMGKKVLAIYYKILSLPGGASGLFGLIMTLAPPPKTAAHTRLLRGCAARRKSSLLLCVPRPCMSSAR